MKLEKLKFSELSEEKIKLIEKMTILDSSLKRYLHDYLDNPTPLLDKTIYLALGQSLLGWSLIGIDSDFGFGEEGMIHLFVNEDSRGSGIGFKMFETALEESIKNGIKKILVYAHDKPSSEFFYSKKVQDLIKISAIDFEIISN